MDCEILYLVVARKKKTVLCEYAQYSGNFEQISIKIITRLNTIPEKQFFSIVMYDSNEMYAFVDNEFIFLAIVDKSCKVTEKDASYEDEWEDCSYYLNEFLYALSEELYKNYTIAELRQSHAYTLVGFVDSLAVSIEKYQSNKKAYKDYTSLIVDIPTRELGYTKKNNESKLSIIKNINDVNEPLMTKELLIEGGDKYLLDSVYLKSDMHIEKNNRKKAICQMIIIICGFLAVILCLFSIIWWCV